MNLEELVYKKSLVLEKKWFKLAEKRANEVRLDYFSRQELGSPEFIKELKVIYLEIFGDLFNELYERVAGELKRHGYSMQDVGVPLKRQLESSGKDFLDKFEMLVSALSTGDYENTAKYTKLVTDVRMEFQGTITEVLKRIDKEKLEEILGGLKEDAKKLIPLVLVIMALMVFIQLKRNTVWPFYFRPNPKLTQQLKQADRLFALNKPKEANEIYKVLEEKILPENNPAAYAYLKQQQGNSYLREVKRATPVKGRMTSGRRGYLEAKKQMEKTKKLRTAIASYREALLHISKKKSPKRYADIQKKFGNAYMNLPTLNFKRGGVKRVISQALATGDLDEVTFREVYRMMNSDEKAVLSFLRSEQAYKLALKGFPEEKYPLESAAIQSSLGKLYFYLWVETGEEEYVEKGGEALGKALSLFDAHVSLEHSAKARSSLGAMYFNQSNFGRNKALLKKAHEHFEKAISELKAGPNPYLYQDIIQMYVLMQLQAGIFDIIGQTELEAVDRVRNIKHLKREYEFQASGAGTHRSPTTKRARKSLKPDFEAIEIPELYS